MIGSKKDEYRNLHQIPNRGQVCTDFSLESKLTGTPPPPHSAHKHNLGKPPQTLVAARGWGPSPAQLST